MNRGVARVGLMTTVLVAVGCGAPPDGRRDEDARAAAEAVDPEYAAMLARGQLLSYSCRACHGLAPDDPSPVGPSLYGMFGRRAASVDGFDYSPVLREADIVWTAESLDAWLAQPDEYLPGNKMAFAGFRSADDRRALIEYLQRHTAAGE